MQDVTATLLERERLAATLATYAAGCGLLLFGLGLYGLLSQHVWQRAPEFGVRLALGASPQRLGVSLLVHAIGLSSVGVLLGISAGFAVLRSAQHAMPGVVSPGWLALSSAFVAVLISTLAAAGLPVRRILKMNPGPLLRT